MIDVYLYFAGRMEKDPCACSLKATQGHDCKRAVCVRSFFDDLLLNLFHLLNIDEKFNTALLLALAQKLVRSLTKDEYGVAILDFKAAELITEQINTSRMEMFMTVRRNFSRVQTGKLMRSNEKQELIDREIALRLCCLKRV